MNAFFVDTWKYFQQRYRGHQIGAAPIFLVGCGHSGTSVLLRLLGTHSKIYGIPYESRVFTHPGIKQRLTSMIWNRNTVAQQKHRWVEKTPVHMSARSTKSSPGIPMPECCSSVRDGRDVAVSMRKRFGNFEKGLRRWVDDNRQGLNWTHDPRVMMSPIRGPG